MLKGKQLLENLELFAELDDRLAEKISGGYGLELMAKFSKLEQLAKFELLEANLLARIQEKIKERFPKIGTDLALGCTSTKYGIYNCTVSTSGQTKSFVVDMNKVY